MSYQPKVYREQGGDTLVVASGGIVNIETGGKLQNNGVDMDLSAGIATSTSAVTAELDTLAGVTPGTAAASKAVVLDANAAVDVVSAASLKLGASGSEVAVTATADELNQYSLTMDIADGSADATYYLICPHAGTISKIYSVIDGAVSTADITITAKIGSTAVTDGAITIATAASAAGDIDSVEPSAENVVTAGQAINLVVAGGGSGGAPRIHVAVVITR